MIIDEVTVEVSAGDGGKGSQSFRREKFIPRGGPDGGNGGDGGNVVFKGTTDLTALKRFRFIKEVKAENGINGAGKKMYGRKGRTEVVLIPIGTHITDLDTHDEWDIEEAGQEIRIARGGRGGKGNFEFRSAQNMTPMEYEEGKLDKKEDFFLDLQFIAHIGLIGLPSAGKSSLLNVLTSADVKVGEYHFTTLEPNLGTVDSIIIADIPGLIEGAHDGKGLGIRFLKHIARTRILAHCIDVTDPDPLASYNTIRKELSEYSSELLSKDEVIVVTKTDLVDVKEAKKVMNKLKKVNPNIFSVSILDDDSLEALKKYLIKIS